jgi:hypothetical protein
MATSFASRNRVWDRTSLLQTVFLVISLDACEEMRKLAEQAGFAAI